MSQGSELERLEQFVAKLLTQYDRLVEKNALLQETLQAREEEIQQLQGQLAQAAEERGHVSGRIKGLIDQIEQWQAAVVEPEAAVAGETPAATFSVVDEPEEVDGEMPAGDDEAARGDEGHGEMRGELEREISLQRNLFNMETAQVRHNSSD